MRFRQIEQLLLPFHVTNAENPAAANRNQRLNDLETLAERIVPGMEERKNPVIAPAYAIHEEVKDRHGCHKAEGVPANVQPGDEEKRRGHQDHGQRSSEIGFSNNQSGQKTQDHRDREQRELHIVDAVLTLLEEVREEK